MAGPTLAKSFGQTLAGGRGPGGQIKGSGGLGLINKPVLLCRPDIFFRPVSILHPMGPAKVSSLKSKYFAEASRAEVIPSNP